MEALSILFQNPYALIAYILVICALLSCWMFQGLYVFAPLYVIAYSFAFMGGIVSSLSLIPLGILVVTILCMRFDLKRFLHLFSAMVVAIIGMCIMTHLLKGFENMKLYNQITFGHSDVPINIYLNFDKASLAVLLLGLHIPLLRGREEWKQMLFITIPWIAFSAFILLGYAKVSNLVVLDLKIPAITLMWLIINFFFVTIPEETFYRGFLQNEITRSLNNKAAPLLAIIVVSIIHALVHLLFIVNMPYIIASFIASVLYGTIFYFTKSVESSILTHFSVNVIHFFIFSYPVLKL